MLLQDIYLQSNRPLLLYFVDEICLCLVAANAAAAIVVVEANIDVSSAAVKITHVKVVDVVDGNLVVVIGVRVHLSIVEIYVLTTAPQYSSYV